MTECLNAKVLLLKGVGDGNRGQPFLLVRLNINDGWQVYLASYNINTNMTHVGNMSQ